jgi:hypothetical protein
MSAIPAFQFKQLRLIEERSDSILVRPCITDDLSALLQPNYAELRESDIFSKSAITNYNWAIAVQFLPHQIICIRRACNTH